MTPALTPAATPGSRPAELSRDADVLRALTVAARLQPDMPEATLAAYAHAVLGAVKKLPISTRPEKPSRMRARAPVSPRRQIDTWAAE